MSAASKEQLEVLHGKLAETLTKALDSEDVPAAVLNVARQLLKDNNIEAVPVPGSSLGKLAEKMTKFPFDPMKEASEHGGYN